jgi:hypothetical protein
MSAVYSNTETVHNIIISSDEPHVVAYTAALKGLPAVQLETLRKRLIQNDYGAVLPLRLGVKIEGEATQDPDWSDPRFFIAALEQTLGFEPGCIRFEIGDQLSAGLSDL